MAALERGTRRLRSVAGGVSISEVTLSEICDLERAGLTHHAFSKHTRLHSTFTNSGVVYMHSGTTDTGTFSVPSVSVSHLPSYVFTRFFMVGHVAFRFRRSSQASHHPYSPFALRQQPQFCPQYPKCTFGDQCRNLLTFWHSWQYQLYQSGLHSVHGQDASKLCAPT